ARVAPGHDGGVPGSRRARAASKSPVSRWMSKCQRQMRMLHNECSWTKAPPTKAFAALHLSIETARSHGQSLWPVDRMPPDRFCARSNDSWSLLSATGMPDSDQDFALSAKAPFSSGAWATVAHTLSLGPLRDLRIAARHAKATNT